MKCPLLRVDDHERSGYPLPIAPDCLKEECAWWNETESECSMLSLAKWPPFLINQVSAIRDKMPSAGQFLK